MNNRELAEFCVHNYQKRFYKPYNDDFLTWDLFEICIAYFIGGKPLFHKIALTSIRCPRCKNYVMYGSKCSYCEKGVIL